MPHSSPGRGGGGGGGGGAQLELTDALLWWFEIFQKIRECRAYPGVPVLI